MMSSEDVTIIDTEVEKLALSPVKFLVNAHVYEMPYQQLADFPLKDALLNMLHHKFTNMTIGVKTKDGAIVIEHPCEHFDKLLQIYANPTITIHQLFNLDFLAGFDVAYQVFKESLIPDGWTDDRLIEQEFMAHRLFEHPSYALLHGDGFKNFKQEMKFFGVYSLLESRLKREIKNGSGSIDPNEIIARIQEALPNLFKLNFGDESRLSYINNNEDFSRHFLNTIKALGMYMSGSFVLKHVLQEDWDCNDIDLYVNETNLKGMLINNHFGGIDNEVFKEKDRILKEFFTIRDARYADRMRDLDITKPKPTLETEYVASLGGLLAHLFKGELLKVHTRTGLLVNNTESSEIETTINERISDDAYMSQHHAIADAIVAVMKFDIQGLKVDLVIVDVTVPYFIDKYFDFAFNKVFYDGYNINALDWKSILNKRCRNTFLEQIGSLEVDYLTNISRINKYTQRGFIIQTRR